MQAWLFLPWWISPATDTAPGSPCCRLRRALCAGSRHPHKPPQARRSPGVWPRSTPCLRWRMGQPPRQPTRPFAQAGAVFILRKIVRCMPASWTALWIYPTENPCYPQIGLERQNYPQNWYTLSLPPETGLEVIHMFDFSRKLVLIHKSRRALLLSTNLLKRIQEKPKASQNSVNFSQCGNFQLFIVRRKLHRQGKRHSSGSLVHGFHVSAAHCHAPLDSEPAEYGDAARIFRTPKRRQKTAVVQDQGGWMGQLLQLEPGQLAVYRLVYALRNGVHSAAEQSFPQGWGT